AGAGLRETVTRLRAALLDGPAPDDDAEPVRIFVTGGRPDSGSTAHKPGSPAGGPGSAGGGVGWRSLPDWPPPARATPWYLSDGGRLRSAPPTTSEPGRYRYDPADPTPALSGPVLGARTSGPVDNRELEARADVLVFTGTALDADLDVIGPVSARLHVTASAGYADFFVRLCDVHPDGRSLNVCDGLLRIQPDEPDAAAADADGIRPVTVELWPTAHRFARGHRIRLQVSSGAAPRFARNPGTGEPLGEATRLVASDQAVHHDADHPSAIVLPVVG
ncbi:MAG: CocE/NonD family hydrolase, partial [Frankia sp.]